MGSDLNDPVPTIRGRGFVTTEVEIEPERKQMLTIFTNYNVDDFVNEQKKHKAPRITSAKPSTGPQQLPQAQTNTGTRPISSYAKQPKHSKGINEDKKLGAESKRPFSAFPKYFLQCN